MSEWTQEYQNALQQIAYGDYIVGFDKIMEGFQAGCYDEQVLEQLYKVFSEPNLLEMKEQFTKNKKLLDEYPHFFCDNLIEPTGFEDQLLLFPVTDTVFYYFNREDVTFHKIVVNSCVETKYFFKDITKPLWVEEEYNEFNLAFLVDNVRDSIDFGGDNHIYLFFETEGLFSLLLYYCDMERICVNHKIVFLVGKEKKQYYPLDPKQDFEIDYTTLPPQPIKLSEVKRLVAFSSIDSHCGNAMIDSLLDYHDNLLTIKEFGLSAFGSFYEEVLKEKTVIEFLNAFIENQQDKKYYSFLAFFCKVYNGSDAALPNFEKFINALRWVLQDTIIPTEQEWFIALYLANAMALERELNSRIVPAIFHAPHTVFGSDWEKETEYFVKFYKTFPYLKTFSALRRPDARIGGDIKYELKCRELYHLKSRECVDIMIRECGDMKNIDWRRAYYNQEAFFEYDQMAILRYEDIKAYPRETLLALCEYLDIPWSDAIMTCTHNGLHTIYNDAGTVIDDFDLAPLSQTYYEKYLNIFDCFRLEVLYAKFYEPLGYKARYYNGFVYSDEEIEKMMEIPFQFDMFDDKKSDEVQIKMKQKLKELLTYMKDWEKKLKRTEVIPCQLNFPNISI